MSEKNIRIGVNAPADGLRFTRFLFLVLAFFLCGTGVLYYRQQQQRLTEAASDQLNAVASLKATQVSSWFQKHESDARLLLNTPIILELLNRCLASPSDSTTNQAVLQWLSSIQRFAGYERIQLLDKQGVLKLPVPASAVDLDVAEMHASYAGVASFTSTELHHGKNGEIHLSFLVPVRATPEAAAAGVLVLTIDARQHLFPVIEDWPTPSRSAETLLVKHDGQDVLYLTELRHQRGSALALRVPMTNTNHVEVQAVSIAGGVTEGVDYRGVPVLAVSKQIADAGWTLIAKIDQDEIYDVLYRERAVTIIAVLVALLAAALGIRMTWKARESHFMRTKLREAQQKEVLNRRIVYLTQQANDSILLLDADWKITEANERAVATYGFSIEELRSLRLHDLYASESLSEFMSRIAATALGEGLVLQSLHRRKNGTKLHVEVSLRSVELEGQQLRQAIVRDVTERVIREHELKRLSRLYATLSQINQTLVRVTSREELCNEVCRVTAEQGGFKLVWLGWIDHDKKRIIPAACAGPEKEYISRITLSIDCDSAGSGPAGTCARTNSLYVANDFLDESRNAPWYDAAAAHDLRAVAVLPIHIEGKMCGLFAVYSGEAGHFKDQEVSLMEEAANNISFSLTHLEHETKRLTAEHALRESEEHYRSLFENMLSGVAYCEMIYENGEPVDFIHLAVNDELEKITGFQNATGKKASELVANFREKDGSLLEVCGRVIATKVPERCEYHSRGLNKWFEISVYSPSKNRFVLLLDGITERKIAEEERARQAAALEQAGECIIITDTNGTIVYVNPAFEKITGYTREEAFRHTPRMLKSGQHDDAFYKLMWDTLSRGEVWQGRLINKRRNHTYYEVEAIISPVRNKEGKIVNYVAAHRDVTHEAILEEQLRQAQKMEAVGRLAGGVAHDFNNILMAVLGYSDLSLKMLAPKAPVRTFIEEIKASGNRAVALTRQLLAFSRKQVLQPQVLNLNDVVGNIEKMLRRLIGEDIELIMQPEQSLPRIKADPGQIEQIIMNLAVNSRDAMPGGGMITITTASTSLDDAYCDLHTEVQPGDYVSLTVTDTGTGMTAETRSHLFEPFFTTKDQGKGTGLGLATVYGIVKQSGGHVEVESELNKGTTFHIYFPVTHEKPPRDSMMELPLKPTSPETVLLVEDDDRVRALVRTCLVSEGHTVLEACNGSEAIEKYGSFPKPIRLMITDIVMPGLSGRATAQLLQPLRPEMSVLFISGYPMQAEELSPHTSFLRKPFTPEALIQRVRELLALSQARAHSIQVN